MRQTKLLVKVTRIFCALTNRQQRYASKGDPLGSPFNYLCLQLSKNQIEQVKKIKHQACMKSLNQAHSITP